jgi:glycosyltransferase involved in cell wall biosynthesis/GT2 family glycosyltransferase
MESSATNVPRWAQSVPPTPFALDRSRASQVGIPGSPLVVPNREFLIKKGIGGLHFRTDTSGKSTTHVIRELARGAWRNGVDTSIEFVQTEPGWGATSCRHLLGRCPDPRIQIGWGDWSGDGDPYSPRVAVDVVDSWLQYMPRHIESYNRTCDLLLVPGENSIEPFVSHGLTIPIAAIPLGVDTRIYRPWPEDFNLLRSAEWGQAKPIGEDTFVFVVAGFMQARKGHLEIVDAFKRAFGPQDDVCLIIKNSANAHGEKQAENINAVRGKSRIGLLEKQLSEWQVARVLSSSDCYVGTHRREGFGLMPLQSMACGTPCLITNYDGPTQYANDDNCILVEPAGFEDVLNPGDQWAILDTDAIVEAMRFAHEDGLKNLVQPGIETAKAWSWDRAAEKMVEAIEENVEPVRRRAVTSGIPKKNSLTVAIPCRNGSKPLERCLESLKDTRWNGSLEILVFDDGSSESLSALCERFGARCIRSEVSLGCSAARDVLVKACETEWYCQSDCDMVFDDPDWAENLRAVVEAEDPPTVVGPVLLDANGRTWGAGGRIQARGTDLVAAGHWLDGQEPPPMSAEPYRCCYLPGALQFGRTELWSKNNQHIGGYPCLWEDVDRAYCMRANGVEFVLVPAVRLTHDHGSFTSKQGAGAQTDFDSHKRTSLDWWGEMFEHDRHLQWVEGARNNLPEQKWGRCVE